MCLCCSIVWIFRQQLCNVSFESSKHLTTIVVFYLFVIIVWFYIKTCFKKFTFFYYIQIALHNLVNLQKSSTSLTIILYIRKKVTGNTGDKRGKTDCLVVCWNAWLGLVWLTSQQYVFLFLWIFTRDRLAQQYRPFSYLCFVLKMEKQYRACCVPGCNDKISPRWVIVC